MCLKIRGEKVTLTPHRVRVEKLSTNFTCMAWASSRLSSSVFMVTNLNTRRFNEAATIASPKSMKMRANITYSGLSLRALSFWRATWKHNLPAPFADTEKYTGCVRKVVQFVSRVTSPCYNVFGSVGLDLKALGSMFSRTSCRCL